jgi:hypothetical protein
MDDLFRKAFVLFSAYERRHDPFSPEIEYEIAAGMRNKSYQIRMRQIMFALAFTEFGTGNQEAFFPRVREYNKTSPDGRHIGPKKFSSPKSLRDYLKKGLAQIHFSSGLAFQEMPDDIGFGPTKKRLGQYIFIDGLLARKSLRAYQELAQETLGLNFSTRFSPEYANYAAYLSDQG